MSIRCATNESVFAVECKRPKYEIQISTKKLYEKCPGCIYDKHHNLIDMEPNQLAHMESPYGCLSNYNK